MKEFIEKLIERLEEYKHTHLIEHNCEICKHCDEQGKDCVNLDCMLCVWDKAKVIVNQLAEEYSANTPQKSAGGWIPVTERLPENKTNVLICCNEFVYYALFEYGHFSNDYGLWYKSVTHWQPLPEPYKSGKSEKAEWKEAVMNHFTKVE